MIGARRAVAAFALVGCAGGEFHLDGPLAKSPGLPVLGGLGMNVTRCPGHQGEAASGLVADQRADVVVGAMSGTASAPHRDLTTAPLFGAAVLADYESFLRAHDHIENADRVSATRAALASAASIAEHAAQVDSLLVGLHAVLLLPRTTTETMVFTFIGERDGRTVAAACASTETVRLAGFFDGPHTTMSCRIVSSADGVAHDLRVRGYGTWANYSFAGELGGATPERATLASQNVHVLGMGGIRGFNLRGRDGAQVAAISFWQISSGDPARPIPLAWLVDVGSPGWSDALLATLSIAYVFPWPSGCDDQHLRNEGVGGAAPR